MGCVWKCISLTHGLTIMRKMWSYNSLELHYKHTHTHTHTQSLFTDSVGKMNEISLILQNILTSFFK